MFMKKEKTTIESFINKSNEIHNNKYDYSKVLYCGTKTKVIIICPEHGEFEQKPEKHIGMKQGCPKCAKSFRKDIGYVINKGNVIHNNKYDYSKSVYTKAENKIIIICPEHGEFEQVVATHLSGGGCPKCYGKNKVNNEVLYELIKVHGDKYDYSKVQYISQTNKLTIICKVHGEFYQTYNTHKKGHGCPRCFNRDRSNDDIIKEFIVKHGDKYDYSKINFINNSTKITIICPIHGEFKQTPANHLRGRGCPKCKFITISLKKTRSVESFIELCNNKHFDKYDYSKTDYTNCKLKVIITCPEHGDFEQEADSHLLGCGCPKCGFRYNKKEDEIKDFINSLNLETIFNSRSIINPLELDIYIPKHKLAIEFDGLYWHNELHKVSNYHINKTEKCLEKGIRLIHIFEDEWILTPDIVKSRINNILGLTDNRIYARKCIIKEVSGNDRTKMLNDNHLQGNVRSSINIGLYHNDELVSLMCFNRPRLGIGKYYDGYELSRFCNKLNTNVVGGASRLLKHFIKNYSPNQIMSYADIRWSDGGLYETLGFEKIKINKPNYWYVQGNKRKHRFNFRKSVLCKLGYDISKTEREIMMERKIFRIYDCGTITYKKTLG